MHQQPLVTVCIPTYNRPEMLRQCLQSVLWQSYHSAYAPQPAVEPTTTNTPHR